MTTVGFLGPDDDSDADVIVVVDVLRAFTTAPWAFEKGCRRVLAVDTHERALALRQQRGAGCVIAGEEGGQKMAGFDFGNSAAELQGHDLTGQDLVLRTSAGTQGLARHEGNANVYAASFVVAAATAAAIRLTAAASVDFVITGASFGRDGDEDLACAEFIASLVVDPDASPERYVTRVASSDSGKKFGRPEFPWWPTVDLQLACEVDRFGYALSASRDDRTGAIELRREAANPAHGAGSVP